MFKNNLIGNILFVLIKVFTKVYHVSYIHNLQSYIHIQTYVKEGRKCFYLNMHISFTVIWHRTYSKRAMREETFYHHMRYSFYLAARVLLYAPSHRQDSTYQLWSTGWNKKYLNGSTMRDQSDDP